MTLFTALKRVKNLDRSLLTLINSQAGKFPTVDKGLALLARNSPDLFYLYFVLAWYGADPEDLELRRHLVASLAAGMTSVGIATVVGRLIDRQRPFSHTDEVNTLLDHHPGHSFPSRHVAGSAGFAAGLGGNQGTLSTIFAITATVVAFSRTYAGVHWPSDLLGGAVIGTGIGRLIRPHISTRLARFATSITLAS